MVEYLLAKGANLAKTNKLGQMPEEIALIDEIVTLFEHYADELEGRLAKTPGKEGTPELHRRPSKAGKAQYAIQIQAAGVLHHLELCSRCRVK
jgi:hypothetical protein